MIEIEDIVRFVEKESKKENRPCSGTWCHACTNNGCCEEQKIWDAIVNSND